MQLQTRNVDQLYFVQALCPTVPDGTRIVINLSGRGDKDVNTAAKLLGQDH